MMLQKQTDGGECNRWLKQREKMKVALETCRHSAVVAWILFATQSKRGLSQAYVHVLYTHIYLRDEDST